MTMEILSLRNNLLALSFVLFTSLISGVLTACSPGTTENSNNTGEISDCTNCSAGDNRQQVNHTDVNHDMDLGPTDTNYNLRFIDGMILHHQGAVEMAKEVQQKSQRPELKQLADAIITDQNQEIGQMQQWRTAWYPNAKDEPMAYHSKMGHMMEMTPEQKQSMMMSVDLGAADSKFDLRFINAMIPHHEGAVVMAKDALEKSQRSEMKKLAQEIIKAQEAEIKQMKQWRQAWYNQ